MATLQGKTALVTGASRGIGRATALALADAGARVLVHYRRAAAEADGVVADIRKSGGHADALKADLAAVNGAAVLAKHAREILDGRLDILVLNAGISKAGAIENHTIDDFDSLFSTNVRSPFFLVQQLLPLLGEGSNIIFVSSLAAHRVPGNPGQPGAPFVPAYAATKGALDTLAKHFATILGPRGIRVNAVAPGFVDTEMTRELDPGQREQIIRRSALRRLPEPADVAAAVEFLLSEQARNITGTTLTVDAGNTA